MKRIITGYAFIFVSAGLALAQTSTGTIEGTVFDPSHALVSGAQVTVTELQTNQSRSQTSNTEGFFEFRALPLGMYSIQVEQKGFTKEVITGVTLQVAATQNIDITLRTGAQSESVTVEGGRASAPGCRPKPLSGDRPAARRGDSPERPEYAATYLPGSWRGGQRQGGRKRAAS